MILKKLACYILGHEKQSCEFSCWVFLNDTWEKVIEEAFLCKRCRRVEIPSVRLVGMIKEGIEQFYPTIRFF